MSSIAVFGYASLVSTGSAAQTLGRTVGDVIPASLPGWRRRWSQARDNHRSEKTFAALDGSLPDWILGLNIEPDPGAPSPGPNGALIEVTAAELERLDLREIRYERVEVTGEIVAGHDFSLVVAYTAKPAQLAPVPRPGSVILRSYAEEVEAAFAQLGPGELERYHASTGPDPVPRIDAELVSDSIPEGNPRRW